MNGSVHGVLYIYNEKKKKKTRFVYINASVQYGAVQTNCLTDIALENFIVIYSHGKYIW